MRLPVVGVTALVMVLPARRRLFFDLFNITNSHSSETISRATGLGYQKPSAILAPRTARLGVRFFW